MGWVKTILILAAVGTYCLTASAQANNRLDMDPYGFDTVLKGGYTIRFHTNDSMQYISLMNGNTIITELSGTSLGLLHKNLGYSGADFTDHFVLVHSFGSGNPHFIELIEKKTGKNLLGDGAIWIHADEAKELLLYAVEANGEWYQEMILYNIKTGKKEYFRLPEEMLDRSAAVQDIEVKMLTDKKLVIDYRVENTAKTKVYLR